MHSMHCVHKYWRKNEDIQIAAQVIILYQAKRPNCRGVCSTRGQPRLVNNVDQISFHIWKTTIDSGCKSSAIIYLGSYPATISQSSPRSPDILGKDTFAMQWEGNLACCN